MPICLINQNECGRQSGEPICSLCGLDERVAYPSVAEREAAQDRADLRYLRARLQALEAAQTQTKLLHGRYQLLAGGSEVKDLQTGLTWARCSVGQHWDGHNCVGKAKRFTFDEAQKLAGNDWRVPTVRELHSLVWCSTGKTTSRSDPQDGKGVIKHDCIGKHSCPTLRKDVFPATTCWYWTSSPYVGDSYGAWNVDFGAWAVNFGDGSVSGCGRDGNGAVRLVRASQ
jgi:hypothetical protein